MDVELLSRVNKSLFKMEKRFMSQNKDYFSDIYYQSLRYKQSLLLSGKTLKTINVIEPLIAEVGGRIFNISKYYKK